MKTHFRPETLHVFIYSRRHYKTKPDWTNISLPSVWITQHVWVFLNQRTEGFCQRVSNQILETCYSQCLSRALCERDEQNHCISSCTLSVVTAWKSQHDSTTGDRKHSIKSQKDNRWQKTLHQITERQQVTENTPSNHRKTTGDRKHSIKSQKDNRWQKTLHQITERQQVTENPPSNHRKTTGDRKPSIKSQKDGDTGRHRKTLYFFPFYDCYAANQRM